ncbi:MAG: Spy/CpxP family protein refolding chaperone [Acidobacteria bacterium]|nr:Spy/CpxP family protein refolding chaperone [Acidobacteriota bacterium]MBV9435594.1 Spy/CpxP family protein refolding chaperone [Acidobacteriota bacterium]
MTVTRNAVAFLIAIIAGSIMLFSQNPSGPADPATMAQHRVHFLSEQLSLTSDQQQQALAIFSNSATSLSSVHEQMKAAHEALRTAVQGNDTNGIQKAAQTIGNLTTQTTAAEATADAAFYKILTPDQQTKLAQLPHHGPGGMHGPPPPGMQP